MHSRNVAYGQGPAEPGGGADPATREPRPRYAAALAAALAAAVAGAAGTATVLRHLHVGCTGGPDSAPGSGPGSGAAAGGEVCPDGIDYGIPALVGGGALAALTLTLFAIHTGRRVAPATRRRMAQHALLLVLCLTSVPGLLWPLLTLPQGHPAGLLGLAGIAFTAAPLATARYRPAALPAVLSCCLLPPLTVLALWRDLLLLLPFAVTLLACWTPALALWLWSNRPGGALDPAGP